MYKTTVICLNINQEMLNYLKPRTKEIDWSGDETNYGNFAFPPAPHNPDGSPVYFNTLQYLQIIFISQIVTEYRYNNILPDNNGM